MKYVYKVNQTQTTDWDIEIEAASEEDARSYVANFFDEYGSSGGERVSVKQIETCEKNITNFIGIKTEKTCMAENNDVNLDLTDVSM